jgi:hypothetical protein
MEALSNAPKVEIMRMLNSIIIIRTSECGSDVKAEAVETLVLNMDVHVL